VRLTRENDELVMGVTPSVGGYSYEDGAGYYYGWRDVIWLDDGDRSVDIVLATPTPTPYIEVNVKNPDGSYETVDVKSIYCDQADDPSSCQRSHTYTDVNTTLTFPKIYPEMYQEAAGAKIQLDMGDTKYHIQSVSASVTQDGQGNDIFELWTDQTASAQSESAVAQSDNALTRLLSKLDSWLQSEALADMEDPDSDNLVWTDANSWNTNGRSMDIVVVTPAIEGGFYSDEASTSGGQDACVPDDMSLDNPVTLTDTQVSASHTSVTDNVSLNTGDSGASSYSLEVDNGCIDCYDVTLALPTPAADAANTYVCACSADQDNEFNCDYSAVDSPNQDVNFFVEQLYLDQQPWWQVHGGHIYAEGNMTSLIPLSTCEPENNCSSALAVSDVDPTPPVNVNSPGFPLTNTGSITTADDGSSYIHLSAERDQASSAHAQGVQVPERNYQYYRDQLGDLVEATLDGTSQPSYDDTDGNGLEVYDYSGDLTIGDDSGETWSVAAGETVVVLVDGNLIFDDDHDLEQIVTVDPGGFVAFIASGDMTITSDVGYDAYNLAPFESPDGTNANLEGVYVADGTLTVAGTTDARDEKFIGEGSFVGWTGVEISRDYSQPLTAYGAYNSFNPVAHFVSRPDLMINTPIEMQEAQLEWQETEPTW
jgi:hypothetical protein